jgi:hypothetical protein
MSSWYFQVQEPREIRDFTLELTLPDLSKAHLNFPEGCMNPTDIKPTADNGGTLLTFRLDHAISSKGMGVALPTVSQAWLVIRFTPRSSSRLLAFQCLLFGLLYPCLAGLDTDRQSLYFNLAALSFLGFAAWQLASTVSCSWPAVQPSPAS